MNDIVGAMAGALRNLCHPAVLLVLLAPMLGALLLWAVVAWWFWDVWLAAIQHLLSVVADHGWLARFDPTRFAGAAASLLLLLVLAPAIIATAALLAALFAMPVLVAHVARRDFPTLVRHQGGTLIGSLWNAAVALGGFVLLWVATLPAWLFAGPLAVAIPWGLSAWLNQRLFRYDALAEHATAAEMREIFAARRGALFGLGLVAGGLYFVPLLNLLAPVFAALIFIQFGLAELQRLRSAGGIVING